MPKKDKPYMAFESRDEFDRWVSDIFNKGKKDGRQEGRELALAWFLYIINREFDNETITQAQVIANKIAKQEFMAKIELIKGKTKAPEAKCGLYRAENTPYNEEQSEN